MRVPGLPRLLLASVTCAHINLNPALANDVTCDHGGEVSEFGISSETFLELPYDHQLSFTIGMIGGWFSSGALGGTQVCQNKLSQCIRGKSTKQLTEVILKFVKDYPEFWHYAINVNAGVAIVEFCKLHKNETAETQGN